MNWEGGLPGRPRQRAPSSRQRQAASLESLKSKLARLRGELQDAYRAWLGSTLASTSAATAGDDGGDQTKWQAYLDAKSRLSEARAEGTSAL